MSEKLGIANDPIKLIAVNNQKAAAIGRDMLSFSCKPYARNLKTKPIPKKFVMITWDIDHFSPVASHTQDQANDLIMMAIPVPGTPQTPSVNNVPHQIKFLTLDATQEIYQGVTSTASQTKMNVRKKNGAVASGR
jgi:hypothetical protein